MAKAFTFAPMTPIEFVARHEGEPCYLCEKPIMKNDEVRYYGGPFIMHSACIENLLESHGDKE